MSKEGIKVLMMGARRSGKTSLLAGLIDTFSCPTIASILKIEDVTDMTTVANKPNLRQKINDVRIFMSQNKGRVLLNNEYGTDKFNDYTVKVSVPNNSGEMEITFTDANGEFYACGDLHLEDMKKKITEYDIIIVTIDTPYLMESAKPGNRLCSKTINKAYNQVDTAHMLLTNLSDDGGLNARLIVFVPIKCEKWAKEGKIDDVTKRVEEVYSVPIRALQAYQNIEVLVLPVETMGNVVFHSHTRPMTLHKLDGCNFRCCEVDADGKVRLGDGTSYKVQISDVLQDDVQSVIEGYGSIGLVRPYSWFEVLSDRYEPKNCEQLALYILQFLLAKTLLAKQRNEANERRNRWWRVAATALIAVAGNVTLAAGLILYSYLKKRMGSINMEKLRQALSAISSKGIWKQNQDGIKILNKGLLEY